MTCPCFGVKPKNINKLREKKCLSVVSSPVLLRIVSTHLVISQSIDY